MAMSNNQMVLFLNDYIHIYIYTLIVVRDSYCGQL